MSSNVVNVSIQSDLNQFPSEKRYDPQIKVLELKKKLELITGANYTSMRVTLFIDDKQVDELSNDEESLAHYLGGDQVDLKDRTIKLVVKDEQPSLILTQEGDAPKYVISEDKYLQRPDNARNFIKEMKKRMSTSSTGSATTAGGDAQ